MIRHDSTIQPQCPETIHLFALLCTIVCEQKANAGPDQGNEQATPAPAPAENDVNSLHVITVCLSSRILAIETSEVNGRFFEYQSINQSIYLSIYLSIYSICLPIYLSNPFPLLLNPHQILKTRVHLQFWKICGWLKRLVIDPL